MYTLCHKDFVRAGGSLVPRAATSAARADRDADVPQSAPFARSRAFKTDAHNAQGFPTMHRMLNGARARRSRTRCGTKNADGDARIGS